MLIENNTSLKNAQGSSTCILCKREIVTKYCGILIMEDTCIRRSAYRFATQIDLVKAQKTSYRHVPSDNQPSSFASTQPCLPKAAPKSCRCVSANNI